MPPKPVLALSRRLEHELAARLEDVESELKRLRKLKIEHRLLKRALRAWDVGGGDADGRTRGDPGLADPTV